MTSSVSFRRLLCVMRREALIAKRNPGWTAWAQDTITLERRMR